MPLTLTLTFKQTLNLPLTRTLTQSLIPTLTLTMTPWSMPHATPELLHVIIDVKIAKDKLMLLAVDSSTLPSSSSTIDSSDADCHVNVNDFISAKTYKHLDIMLL